MRVLGMLVVAVHAAGALLACCVSGCHAATPEQDGRRLFSAPASFGPQEWAFSMHCAFSPDGKWVAIVRGGTDGGISMIEASSGRLRTTVALAVGGFEAVFTEDSRRVATVGRDVAVELSVCDGAWTVARQVPLGFATITDEVLCPRTLYYDGNEIRFAEDAIGYRVDMGAGTVGRTSSDGDVVLAYMNVDDDACAEVHGAPVRTRIVSKTRGERSLVGALVGACRTTWLVAEGSRYPYGRLELTLMTAWERRVLARFESGSEGGRRVPRWQLRKAVFSSDGALLATVEGSDVIWVRDGRTGVARQCLAENGAMGVAISPDGRRLVTVSIWSVAQIPMITSPRPPVLMWTRARER